jgi:hypothetical protein
VDLMARSIYFWSDSSELELARRLAYEEAGGDKRAKGIVRDASLHDGAEVEPCDRVVLLSSVQPWHADKIIAAYGKLVPIERREREPVATPDPTLGGQQLDLLTEISNDVTDITLPKLRRLTNRQIHELAKRLGIDLSTQLDRGRMSLINTILEASAARMPSH